MRHPGAKSAPLRINFVLAHERRGPRRRRRSRALRAAAAARARYSYALHAGLRWPAAAAYNMHMLRCMLHAAATLAACWLLAWARRRRRRSRACLPRPVLLHTAVHVDVATVESS
jgi:hypothetical protein